MAQKYVVKNEDNPLTLAKKFETSPQAILQNNAIKSLTAGQTIKVPNSGSVSGDKQGQLGSSLGATSGPFVVNNNPILNNRNNNTQAQGSFVSGSGQVNTAQVPMNGTVPRNVTNGGYLSSNGTYTSTAQNTNVHAQVPIYGQITSAQLQQQIAQQNAAQAPATPARPSGVYTGNPSDPNTAQWRNYWNWQAANPNLVQQAAPVVMTRDQVWNMKAAQRRMEDDGSTNTNQDFVSYQPYLQPVQPTYEPFFGNNIMQGSFRG